MSIKIAAQNNSPEILYVNSKKVSCRGEREGFASGSGHPTIYLDMGKNESVVCPYCSKFFTIKHKPASAGMPSSNLAKEHL